MIKPYLSNTYNLQKAFILQNIGKVHFLLGFIDRYFTEPENLRAADEKMCVGLFQAFTLIDIIVFDVRHVNKRREARVTIPDALRISLLKEFHDTPMSRNLGCRKHFVRASEVCYFPNSRKFCYPYVRTCEICQRYNYVNFFQPGILQSQSKEIPLQIVGLDLIGPVTI